MNRWPGPKTGSTRSSDADANQWWLPCPRDLLWERWEKDYTIFNRNTRETHLLNELPAEILRILADQPATTSEVSLRLARRCEVENDPEWQRKVSDQIRSLASLRLIEKLPR